MENVGHVFSGFNIVVTEDYCFADGQKQKKSGNVLRKVNFFMIFKDKNSQGQDFSSGRSR